MPWFCAHFGMSAHDAHESGLGLKKGRLREFNGSVCVCVVWRLFQIENSFPVNWIRLDVAQKDFVRVAESFSIRFGQMQFLKCSTVSHTVFAALQANWHWHLRKVCPYTWAFVLVFLVIVFFLLHTCCAPYTRHASNWDDQRFHMNWRSYHTGLAVLCVISSFSLEKFEREATIYASLRLSTNVHNFEQ